MSTLVSLILHEFFILKRKLVLRVQFYKAVFLSTSYASQKQFQTIPYNTILVQVQIEHVTGFFGMVVNWKESL